MIVKMMSVWDSDHIPILEDLKDNFRVVSGVYGNLTTVLSELPLDGIKTKYTQIKRRGLRCRSVKLFFDGDSIPDLSEKGLKKYGVTWRLEHPKKINIAAVPYGKSQWCFMIEKRTGQGVPLHALDFVPKLDHQLEWRVAE